VSSRETVYDARPQLETPRLFLRNAWNDLRASPRIAHGILRSNLRIRYRRSWLGYLWLPIPAVATMLASLYLQSRHIIGLPATRAPYAIFVFTGIVLWQVFLEAVNVPLQQLATGRQLMTRTRVPHEALILAGMLEVLVNAGIRGLLVVAALIPFGVALVPSLLLAPVGVVLLASLGLFAGLALAPLGMLYDDVGRAIMVGTGFLFFLTPVIYPAHGHRLVELNPVTPLLEITRSWVLSERHGSAAAVVVAAAVTVVGLVLSWLFYRVSRPHMIARLG
jgi:lipopolysaccharide transport system permease protein